tara:strand:+ start:682 stop:1824 length:1143 start_codon:yes stop_codon:yes gene_type:complete
MDFNNSKMKTSLLILISFLTITAHSQNNLFFDEVKLIRFSTQPSVTVPSGKVWKIVGSDLEGTNQSVNININGEPFFLSGVNTGVNNQIWLPEGTVVSRGTASNSSGAQMSSTISVIQYAVIPISSSTTGSTASTGGFTSTTDFVGSGQYTTTNDYTVADSFTDIDGNEYGAINLNGNIWSSSDLKVTKFTDGTPIPLSTSIQDFQNTSKAAYFINNGTYLYNWQAIVGEHDGDGNTELKKLAPEGYRIPLKADWNILTDFYGGEMFAAHYLMSKTSWPGGKNGINKSGLNLKNITAYAKNGISSTTTSFSLAWATHSYYYRVSSGYQLFWAFTLSINNGASNGYETKPNAIYATNSSPTGVSAGYANNSGVAVRVIKEY